MFDPLIYCKTDQVQRFGYTLAKFGKTGGSRVKFIHETLPPIILHKPHPTPVLKKYQLEQIEETLKAEGLI